MARDRKDRIRGCLVGGAVGDALGYAVEFMSLKAIRQAYGPDGITSYELSEGLARVSDDTQMTLFTASGLVEAKKANLPPVPALGRAYVDWFHTQTEAFPAEADISPLVKDKRFYSRRAPGTTCLTALAHYRERKNLLKKPLNDSKGCGGVMRVAPVGLWDGLTDLEVAKLGAEAAAITHGHSLGWIPSAALALFVKKLVDGDEDALALKTLEGLFGTDAHWGAFVALMDAAQARAKNALSDEENIRALGEGWVAEETLAIAVYCALRYPDDFEKAIVASVNHDGDSDSTGAVTGNLLGAKLGLEGIPQKYRENLEFYEELLKLADELQI